MILLGDCGCWWGKLSATSAVIFENAIFHDSVHGLASVMPHRKPTFDIAELRAFVRDEFAVARLRHAERMAPDAG